MKKIIVLLLALLAFGCDNKPSTPPVESFTSVTIPFTGSPNINDHSILTPGGVRLRSVSDVPMRVQLAIDEGVRYTLETDGRLFPGWTRFRSMSEIQIFIIEPDFRTVENDPGAPALNIRYRCLSTQPCTVGSADTVIGTGVTGDLGGYQMYLSGVIASDEGSGWQHTRFVRNAARYTTEHLIECANDVSVCTQFTTASDVHPHFGADIWNVELP